MKHQLRHWSIDEILDKIPDQPFVVALGTSHTFGSCSNSPDGALPDNETWAGYLSALLGMPVLNFGIPGVHNINLATVLTEFLDISDSKIKNCKMVIMEPRIWDARSLVASDLFERPVPSKELYSNPLFTSTRHYNRTRTWHNEYMVNVTSNPQENLRVHESIKKTIQDNGIKWHKDFSQRWESCADAVVWSSGFSTMEIYQNLNYINICSKMCKFKNIPFKWFAFVSKVSHSIDIEYRNALYNALQSLPNNVFDSKILAFDDNVIRTFKLKNPDVEEKTIQCGCGHYTAALHEWIAYKIKNEIKDVL